MNELSKKLVVSPHCMLPQLNGQIAFFLYFSELT